MAKESRKFIMAMMAFNRNKSSKYQARRIIMKKKVSLSLAKKEKFFIISFYHP